MAMTITERLATTYEWIEPTTLDEAEARLAAAIDTKLDIEAQLADKDRRYPDGSPMDSVDYHQWRGRAIWKKRYVEKELSALRAWVKAAHLRGEGAPVPIVPDNTDAALMYTLFRMARIVNGERVPWDAYAPDEQIAITTAQARLRAFGVRDGELGI